MNFMTVYKSLSSTLILKQYIVIASNLNQCLKKSESCAVSGGVNCNLYKQRCILVVTTAIIIMGTPHISGKGLTIFKLLWSE